MTGTLPSTPLPLFFFYFQIILTFFARRECCEFIIFVVKLFVVEVKTVDIKCEVVLTLYRVLKSFCCLTHRSNLLLCNRYFSGRYHMSCLMQFLSIV